MYILIPMSGVLIIYVVTEMSFQTAALKNRTSFLFSKLTQTPMTFCTRV